ncbi:MAG: lysine--tRNA ligase [Proteobacteria bacterium]|nr:MAG: lysine--tRNA ligase [Pseudomonadota bacterium]
MSEAERKARAERLAALRATGADPYPASVGPLVRLADVRARWDALDAAALEADPPPAIAVAGRVMAIRSFGKLVFMTLREDGASLQVSFRKPELAPAALETLGLVDVGDFVRAEGVVWRTRTGELTVGATSLRVVSKSLHPMPEKWHGLVDVEARYRQRYLDLLVNEEARRIAVTRSRVITAMRAFLDGRGFLEVETPVLQPLYGGAHARPFSTHYEAYDQDVFLRISDELYLKRLVIGGLDRVYEIGHNFRNEGVSRKHNPEFTMMECYQAFADYRDMMELVQSMFQHVVVSVTGGTRVTFREHEIEFGGEWPRIAICDALRDRIGIDVLAAPDFESLYARVLEKGLDPGDAPTWGQLVDHLFSEHVEPTLIQPTLVTNHPVELSPLAKRSSEDPRLVERFEPFVAGMELGNAFSELNDPADQRARFEEQRAMHAAGDAEAHPLDEDFLLAMEHGMPPTGGLGVGIDRLVIVLTDAQHIREVLLFPYMRPES